MTQDLYSRMKAAGLKLPKSKETIIESVDGPMYYKKPLEYVAVPIVPELLLASVAGPGQYSTPLIPLKRTGDHDMFFAVSEDDSARASCCTLAVVKFFYAANLNSLRFRALDEPSLMNEFGVGFAAWPPQWYSEGRQPHPSNWVEGGPDALDLPNLSPVPPEIEEKLTKVPEVAGDPFAIQIFAGGSVPVLRFPVGLAEDGVIEMEATLEDADEVTPPIRRLLTMIREKWQEIWEPVRKDYWQRTGRGPADDHSWEIGATILEPRGLAARMPSRAEWELHVCQNEWQITYSMRGTKIIGCDADD